MLATQEVLGIAVYPLNWNTDHKVIVESEPLLKIVKVNLVILLLPVEHSELELEERKMQLEESDWLVLV